MLPVYDIHRRIDAPLQFKGLKAQYIVYAGAITLGSTLLLSVLYMMGLSFWLAFPCGIGPGTAGLIGMWRLSHRFGEHGLQKYWHTRRTPKLLRVQSRILFVSLKK